MTMRAKGLAVLAVQLLLVLSIAGKYAWERQHCPRIWTRTMQFDPEQPIRGRYLALTLRASACGLSDADALQDYAYTSYTGARKPTEKSWKVVPAVRDGKLAPSLAGDAHPEETQQLVLRNGVPCEAATLSGNVEYFIGEHAQQPFPLKHGEELWAEVTVPPTGPPRPLRLAISDGKNFRVLDLK